MSLDHTAPDSSVASRWRRKVVLDNEISNCRRCRGLNIPKVTASAPGYGNLTSPVALVGQSLCEKCMETQIPFTGGSGDLIDGSIKRAGQEKEDLFITNAVHCHPPKNRASFEHEIVNCSPFLHRELEIVQPRLVIALGRDAERVVAFFHPGARVSPKPFEPRGSTSEGCALHPQRDAPILDKASTRVMARRSVHVGPSCGNSVGLHSPPGRRAWNG